MTLASLLTSLTATRLKVKKALLKIPFYFSEKKVFRFNFTRRRIFLESGLRSGVLGGLGPAIRAADWLPGQGKGMFSTRDRQKVEPKDLLVTAKVIDKVEQTNDTTGTEQADGANRKATKTVGNEAKRVFNTAANLGF